MPTIHVYLRNEGVDVWRPVEAERVRADLYRIVSVNGDPVDEEWRFHTGDVVRCEARAFSEGRTGLVAVERVSGTA